MQKCWVLIDYTDALNSDCTQIQSPGQLCIVSVHPILLYVISGNNDVVVTAGSSARPNWKRTFFDVQKQRSAILASKKKQVTVFGRCYFHANTDYNLADLSDRSRQVILQDTKHNFRIKASSKHLFRF